MKQMKLKVGLGGNGLTGFRPPFLFWIGAASCAIGPRSPSGSGDEIDELVKPSSRGSSLGITKSGPMASAAVISAAAIDPIPAALSLTKSPGRGGLKHRTKQNRRAPVGCGSTREARVQVSLNENWD